MTNTYIDCFQYQQAPTGLSGVVTNSIGNQFRLTSAQAAGVGSLSIPSGLNPNQINPYDSIYIFDGPKSEVVQASATVQPYAGTISLVSPTQYQHAIGTPLCCDGVLGSLGQQIFIASRWIEDICHQSLWSTAYTGEVLTLPTMRASIDNQWNLHFRPRHFPITALSSVVIQTTQLASNVIDPTQAIIDADQQTVDIPNINFLNSGSPPQQGTPYVWQQLTRKTNAWITLGYTAGFAVGQLPWAIIRACTLLTSEMFVQTFNPMGADDLQQGKRRTTFTLRGDPSGESLLYKQALKLITPYIAQNF